jgi:hypothetical protein
MRDPPKNSTQNIGQFNRHRQVCSSSDTEHVNEPISSPQDTDIDDASFWLDTDLEDLLTGVERYQGAAQFAIDDLTSDEWWEWHSDLAPLVMVLAL